MPLLESYQRNQREPQVQPTNAPARSTLIQSFQRNQAAPAPVEEVTPTPALSRSTLLDSFQKNQQAPQPAVAPPAVQEPALPTQEPKELFKPEEVIQPDIGQRTNIPKIVQLPGPEPRKKKPVDRNKIVDNAAIQLSRQTGQEDPSKGFSKAVIKKVLGISLEQLTTICMR